MGRTEQELQEWRMSMTRKQLLLEKPRHTRLCVLCGNRHPLTAHDFIPTERPDRAGFIKGGLAFICNSCNAFWGETKHADAALVLREREKRGRWGFKAVRSFIDYFGEKTVGGHALDE